MKRLRNFLITTIIGGLVIILPLTIFFLLIQFLVSIIRKLISPLSLLLSDKISGDISPLILDTFAMAVIIAFCFVVGLIIKTRFGNNFYAFIEDTWLLKLPFYGAIKETVKQFVGVKKMPFSDVVIVEAFEKGTLMTGFITDEHKDGTLTVFVPTAPNPTNGFVFHLPKEKVRRIKVPTEEAMRTIIGVGTGSADIMKFE